MYASVYLFSVTSVRQSEITHYTIELQTHHDITETKESKQESWLPVRFPKLQVPPISRLRQE